METIAYLCGMNHIRLTFTTSEQEQKDTLIALLSDRSTVTGFEEAEEYLNAYMEASGYDDAVIQEIAALLGVTYTQELVAPRNWNAEWEQHFQPVLIDDFVSIRADFHPLPEHVAHDIVITPKMSFGTGHHATTALMVALMRTLDFREKQVFDFGTGTGILAILAEKLGADAILAIDNDTWSYENALENCGRNDCKKIQVQLGTADDLSPAAQFGIILANINRHILLLYMDKMQALLEPGGDLLLSGILVEDVPVVKEAAVKAGLREARGQNRQGWACLHFQKA